MSIVIYLVFGYCHLVWYGLICFSGLLDRGHRDLSMFTIRPIRWSIFHDHIIGNTKNGVGQFIAKKFEVFLIIEIQGIS